MSTWTCQRVTNGQKCGTVNSSRLRKCLVCRKPRPPRRRPKHMEALELPYEAYVELNGGEFCGVCGREPSPGRKLDRDHDHKTKAPRGLLCWKCNKFLHSWMDWAWLRCASDYLRRAERTKEGL